MSDSSLYMVEKFDTGLPVDMNKDNQWGTVWRWTGESFGWSS